MTQAKLVWSIWQSLLASFAGAFSVRGHRRFVEWITALAINVEEHTITQSVLALERPADWKARVLMRCSHGMTRRFSLRRTAASRTAWL